jgi:putative MATE family efflux protein
MKAELETEIIAERTQGPFARVFGTIREAIVGSHQDFTEIGIGRAITLLAIPMVIEMSMESLFGIVDVFFVAGLGADAVAVVGLTESLLTLVFAVAIGLSMATTAMVARRIGEKDTEGAARASVQAIFIGIAASIPIGVVGFLFTPAILDLMGATESVIENGSSYGTLILGGNVIIMLLFLLNAIFRGAGDAAIAMRVLLISNAINIVLDPCLILGLGPFPEMGVTGAALATNIGRSVGVVYQFYVLLTGRSRIKVSFGQFRIDPKVMLGLLRVSLGGIFQFLVATASWVALVRIVAIFGSSALAGYTIALRIIIFALLPSWGMSNAAATLVGQNLGAQKPERAERSVWVTGFANMVFLGIVTVVFIVLAEPLIRIFTDDESVVVYGTSCLRFISYGYVFYAYAQVMVAAFNGAGDTRTPTFINLAIYWLFQIPLAYLLAVSYEMDAYGVFVAITISESLLAVVAVLLFRRGRWKQQKI